MQRPSTLLEPRKVLELIGRTAAGAWICAQAAGGPPGHQAREHHVRPRRRCAQDHGFRHRAAHRHAGSTRTGIVLGTPSFMSPEQLEGRTVTGHSDLFSLGVSLFQLLTGQLAVHGRFDDRTDAADRGGTASAAARLPAGSARMRRRRHRPRAWRRIPKRGSTPAPDGGSIGGLSVAHAERDCHDRER